MSTTPTQEQKQKHTGEHPGVCPLSALKGEEAA